MTAPLPFTQASIRRAVEGARKAGLRVTGIRATDGTVLVEEAGLARDRRVAQTATPSPDSEVWRDVEA